MELHELARRQMADYDRREPGSLFAGAGVSLTIEQAYLLQFEVARLREARGERIIGYKAGCVSRVMQEQLGLDRPVFGHVFESEMHRSGAALDFAKFAGLAIEGEFAVRIGGDSNALQSAFPVIELHNFVFRNNPHGAAELIGNNAIHAGIVMPLVESPLTDPEGLAGASIRVSRSGVQLGETTGRALPDGPAASVAKLSAHLALFGRTLLPGQIVLTGSPLPLYRVAPGDRIDVETELFGSVAATVV